MHHLATPCLTFILVWKEVIHFRYTYKKNTMVYMSREHDFKTKRIKIKHQITMRNVGNVVDIQKEDLHAYNWLIPCPGILRNQELEYKYLISYKTMSVMYTTALVHGNANQTGPNRKSSNRRSSHKHNLIIRSIEISSTCYIKVAGYSDVAS